MGLLSGRIVRLEYMVKELLGELEGIKEETRSLEQENQKLRQKITAVYVQRTSVNTKETAALRPDSEEPTLMNLYDEGFHICNVKFAQIRKEECLFCFSLLRRQKDSEK